MKTLHIKHIIGGLLFVSSMALFSACSGTDDLVDTTGVSGLKVSLAIGDASLVSSKASTRADADVTLNEDKIENLNVLFYKADDGTLAKGYYLTDDLANGDAKLLSSGSEWTSSLIPGKTYNVYAVANQNEDLSQKTLDEVKALMNTDADIYKKYDADSNSNKLFLMDGSYPNWTIPTDNDNVTIPITLQRAADKIVLDISLDGTHLIQTGEPWTWNIVNYATNTSVLSSQTYDRAVASTETGTSVTPSNNAASITTYCYDNSWDNSISGQTMIELNIPCKYNDEDYSINKYRLPITTLKSTGRNNIYKITAKLDKLGNTNTEEHYDLAYAVKEWLTYDINIDDSNVKYLIVSPQEVVMKNIADYNEIQYYSSSAVSVSVDKAYYFDPNQDEVNVDINECHITANAVNSTATSTSGTIQFHSDIPTNLGPRYIELTVTNSNGLSRSVLIKQYPLEYITAIAGSFSYKNNDSNSNPSAALWGWPEYKDYGKGYYEWGKHGYEWNSYASKYYDDIFKSKYYVDGTKITKGTIYYIYHYYGWDSSADSNNNNNMYVVRITSTSDKYRIDKPLITNGLTDGSANNNNVVSPAFMLASQLGTVSPTNWKTASKHCQNYVEVGLNGTVYSDWRLPTLSELAVISEYQNSGKGVMATVLGGESYWSAYHISDKNCGYYKTGYDNDKTYHDGWAGSETGVDANNSCYIRCIRDLTPAELANDK
jgi:hypothetical protein